jgi:hypothetical protein
MATRVTPSIITSGGSADVPTKWGEADFRCWLTNWDGMMSLDDHIKYIVEASSFQASTMTWRRNQVQGPYVAGKFTVSAVPDTVVENVAVWVLGDNQTDLAQNLSDLIEAVSQPAYQLIYSLDEMAYTWNCEMADYTMDFTHTNAFARQVLFKFAVPRLPAVTMGPLT